MTKKDAYLFLVWSQAHFKLGAMPSLQEFLHLRKAYSEPGRYYHTWTHIHECVKFFLDTYGKVPGWEQIIFALFYHDAIYAVPGPDNELHSAKLWEAYAERFIHIGKLPRADMRAISDMILMTKTHKPATGRGLLFQIMSDVDMAIIGAAADVYLDYARNIWHEYKAVGVDAFVTGRLQFLSTVNPDGLFHTHQAREKLLANARANLAMEHKLLTDSPNAICIS